MEITFIGLIQIVFGLGIVLIGTPRATFLFLALSCLLEGSASILLPAIGSSSIPPIQFALLFVFLRILVPRGGLYGLFPQAISANRWLVLFSCFGIAMAVIGPRLFEGSISIFPMEPDKNAGLFDLVPLEPTNQNITAAGYMLGTLLIAVASYMLCQVRDAANSLLKFAIFGGWFMLFTGLLDLVSRGTPVEPFLDFFRNGSYSQLHGEVEGFVRIRGLMPEASTFAATCFAFFVLNTEIWFRSIRSRHTGLLSILCGLMLVISTSSTAYVALAGYALFFLARALALPTALPSGKMIQVIKFAFLAIFVLAIAMLIVPRAIDDIYQMMLAMTFEKPVSESGQQRLFWALQGWRVFFESYGLGIGPGSFRSSSLIMAIIGSMGAIGIASFVLYVLTVFKPLRRSTWGDGIDENQSLGGALASAAILGLIPPMVGSPLANPPTIFAVLAGAALALRPGLVSFGSEGDNGRVWKNSVSSAVAREA